jgi:CheY-like chemotaxis protein
LVELYDLQAVPISSTTTASLAQTLHHFLAWCIKHREFANQRREEKHMGIFGAAVALFGKGGSQPVEKKPRARHPDETTESKATILIIDDDPSFLDTMRTVLRDEGYNVLASSTGPKGLDMVRYAKGDVGAILLDFNMPRFNGAETLPFLRKLSPKAKVLAVSGVSSNELPADFRDGVERLLPKPFSNADLLKALEEILDDDKAADAAATASA